MSYYKNKNIILDYIDKSRMCKECCQELKDNIEAFKHSTECFRSIGYVDMTLVDMLSSSIDKIINKYTDKMNKMDKDTSNEKN